MKILTASQIREADRYTLQQESIDSLQLMERASEVIAQWISEHVDRKTPLCFMVGKGNNGGDALVVARILYNAGYDCRVYTLFDRKDLSSENRYNLEHLPRGLRTRSWMEAAVPRNGLIVDGLLGSGVRGPVKGVLAQAIDWINAQDVRVISIDLPSGLQTEYGNAGVRVVRAWVTLTLEFPKLALLLPEAGDCAGKVVVLPIGLDAGFIKQTDSPYAYVDEALIRQLRKPRRKFAHKGDYGHALLVCGSEGMIGAALLSTAAALRSGCGLVTVHMPRQSAEALYASSPSAMLSADPQPHFSTLPVDTDRFTTVGVGCGLGRHPESVKALEALLKLGKPMVIDADALNILAEHPDLQSWIPASSVLTPHPGELRRWIGPWADDRERNERASALARRLSCYVVVKGAHTMTCTPEGKFYFNATGNAGMAKGGSGDVLTGLITGLMARGYRSGVAAVMGVYLHGQAGDRAAEHFGPESLNSGDLLSYIRA